jgi:fibronectin type 3 domain-containing protein
MTIMIGRRKKQHLCYIFLSMLLLMQIGCKDLLHPETSSVPAVPVELGVELVSATSVRVFWDAVPDATQYEVYDETNSRMTTYTSLIISELKENTTYRFTVKAGNATGWSVPSDAVSITTPASAAIPAAPSGVTATALSISEIIVSWQPSGGATKYQVHDGAKDYDTDKTYYTVQGLSENTAYQFTVKAGNNAGWSAASTPPASAATLSAKPEGSAPAAPTGVTATALASGEVLVTWTVAVGAETYLVAYGTAQNATTTFGASTLENFTTVIGLSPNTVYYFSVKAGNSSGWSVASDTASATTVETPEVPKPPATPQNISALVLSESSVSLSWDSVEGAVSYTVYRSQTENSGFTGIGTSSTASYTDTGLGASTTYYYKVRTIGALSAESALSDAISATTLAAGSEGKPPAPQGVSATALSVDSIRVSWNVTSAAASYKIYRSGSEDGAYAVVGASNTTSYTNTSLGSSTTFYYKVSAVSSGGEEGPRSAAAFATTHAMPPAQPQGLSATALSSSSIKISWTTVVKAASYKIYRSGTADGDYADIGSSDTTNYTDMDLNATTAYYYRVSALGPGGSESALSDSVSATTPEEPLSAPQDLNATALSFNSIGLNWEAVDRAVSYKVYRSANEDGDFSPIDTSVATSYINSDLAPSTTYYYRVSAIAPDGAEGPLSLFATATTPAEPPPAPQSISAIAISSSSVAITWTAVEGAASYKVYRSGSATGTFVEIGTSSTVSYTDTGLSAATAYYYKASAVNGESLESALSVAATITTPAPPPGTPLGVSATASAPGSITLSWQPVAGAAYYQIYRAANDAGPYASLDSSTVTEYTDLGLNPSTVYYYKVSAFNADGLEGGQSSAISATTSAEAGARLVPHTNIADALTWLANNVENNGSYIIRLEVSSSIGPKTLSYTGKNNITITLVGSGANRIISLNATGTLFTVSSGITLILDDRITLNGRTNNSNRLVQVNSGGTLIINEGAKITGNKYSNTSGYGGGAVYVSGTFIMNGGEISGNTYYSSSSYSSYGGGVYVYTSGAFTMNGGKIRNNIASYTYSSGTYLSYGGGVAVNGTFTMNDGEISGNTSSSTYTAYGGGVNIGNDGVFTMNGGTISGNTVSTTATSTSYFAYGGGVFVSSTATFTMTGGTITGNTASAGNSSYGGGVYTGNTGLFTMNGGTISGNTAKYGGGVSVNSSGLFTKAAPGGVIYGSDGGTNKNTATGGDGNGHAVYVSGDSAKKRNSTAGALVELDSTTPGSEGGWE